LPNLVNAEYKWEDFQPLDIGNNRIKLRRYFGPISMTAIRFTAFPRTQPPPEFATSLIGVFQNHSKAIGTLDKDKGLTSDAILARLAPDLMALGFLVETSKSDKGKIKRPVFFGEGGRPDLRYEIDSYHPQWRCGLEVEAGRAWLGNAIYRDLIQAMVMVDLDWLALAVPLGYRRNSVGRRVVSRDYDNTCAVANTLFSHDRVRIPFQLLVIGY